ncbi:uncharacterized protein LOC114458605 isoform X2 [Gouania willdenowi]|uniref:uncharacterized protein LOC114458605 isoform X2 n=1 Tax=Gouania willdenowi TaxID=441366 RepID=UPI0010567317|nr:uncharacterized protein LOC114458605 isoform X2 [Gouania willdenowi]
MTSATRLLYCTTGVLLRRLEGDANLKGVTHLIVDEVHERTQESDFLLLVLKDLIVQRPDLKICFVLRGCQSATERAAQLLHSPVQWVGSAVHDGDPDIKRNMENPSMEQLAEPTLETPTAELRTPHHKVSKKAPLSFNTPDYSKVKSRVQFPKGQYKPPKMQSKAHPIFNTPDYSKVESRVQFPKGQYKPPKMQSKAHPIFNIPDYSEVKSRVQCPKGQYKPPKTQRKAPLSFPTPDYSKVEPRVKFPKGQYKPPKSRRPLREDSVSPQAPLPFTSPADLVREVLDHTADGSSSSDFSSPQQAITLVDQLQENYMELLIEHAEAENTIDQLRLTAKVKLCWDDLTAAHCVQSAATQSASSPIQLDFPQAQGAQMDACFPPGSLPTRPESDSPDPQLDPLLEPPLEPELRPQLEQQLETQLGPQLGQQLGPQLEQQLGPQRGQQLGPQLGQELGPQLGIVLSQQAKMLLQQMQTFGDLLKSRKLSLEKQTEGLCHLSETLDSLVKSFLLTNKELRCLKKQHRADLGCLDPTRTLKAQIYYSVYLMRKLKKYQEQLYETPPPSFPVQPLCSSTPRTPPQFPADPGEMKELRSTREGSDDDYKHTLTSHFLPPLSDAHTHMDQSSQSSCFPGPVPSTTRTTTRTSSSSSSSSSTTTSSSRRRRIIPGERRSSKVQSQDGIISPELDTGFIRSESSPLPPSPVHQMTTESVRLFRCDSIESISAEESSRNPPSVFHPPTNASTAQQEKSGRSRSLYCSSPQRVTCSRMRSNVQPPALMSRSTQTSAAVERSSRTPQHHCCRDSAPHRVRPVKSQHNRALFLRQFLPGCPPQKLFYPSPHSGSRLGF